MQKKTVTWDNSSDFSLFLKKQQETQEASNAFNGLC